MISFVPTLKNTADLFTKFLNSVQHHAFCQDLGIGRLDLAVTAMTSPMRGSIRVDCSASKTDRKLEPAAAGTSDDSSLLDGFLRDLFQKKDDSDEKKLFSFLGNLFSSHV